MSRSRKDSQPRPEEVAHELRDTEAAEAYDRNARALGVISSIRTRPPTRQYHEGWDRIFGKKKGST